MIVQFLLMEMKEMTSPKRMKFISKRIFSFKKEMTLIQSKNIN